MNKNSSVKLFRFLFLFMRYSSRYSSVWVNVGSCCAEMKDLEFLNVQDFWCFEVEISGLLLTSGLSRCPSHARGTRAVVY